MKRCFLICGVPSAGNRLLASILIRGGCQGSASTDQYDRWTGEGLPTEWDVVWIVHDHVERVHRLLCERGYEVRILIVVREWFAHVGSMVQRTFHAHEDVAGQRILSELQQTLTAALRCGAPTMMLTFEGLGDKQAVVKLLRGFGLRTDNLDEPLRLDGQNAPPQPEPLAANRKHYT